MALTDALTGLPNRRALEETLERAWNEAKGQRTPLCLGIADIDFFKSFNDRYGHQTGDECLRVVARALAAAVREEDFAGRYGGEEFLILFPGIEAAAAVEIAERMRAAVSSAELVVEGAGRVAVSISIGIGQVRWDSDTSMADAVATADSALYRAKRSGRNRVNAPGHETSFLRELSEKSSRHRFPKPRTELVGRSQILEQICVLLKAQRCVTLTGPGGIGKTRLALEAAQRTRSEFIDGSVFLDLTDITQADRVSIAFAESFGIHRPDPAAATESLQGLFRDQRALLVIDSCEHVIDAAADLIEAILDAGSDVHVLATSREPLNVPDEYVYRVPALDPDSALELFENCARHVENDFTADQCTETILDICRHLDGIPLAIELAAPRIRMLSPAQLLEALADRFSILTGGARTVHPHHRTMRALFDWSYRLLNASEQHLFRSLSVFTGGWTLDAAYAVNNNNSKQATFDALSQLIDKSLVVRPLRSDVTQRYRFLESTRHYARELLRDDPEEDSVTNNYVQFFASLAAESAAAWTATPTNSWLSRYMDDAGNFRTVLQWCIDDGRDITLGTRIACDLTHLWHEMSQPQELVTRFTRLLDENKVVASMLPESLLSLAWLLDDIRDPRVAAATKRIFAMGDAPSDERPRAYSELYIARLHIVRRDDRERAEQLLREATQRFERLRDAFGTAEVLNALGLSSFFRGDHDDALRHYGASLDIFRNLGKDERICRELSNIGQVHYCLGNYEKAAGYYHESMLQSELPGAISRCITMMNLGEVELELGHLESARQLLRRARRIQSLAGSDYWAAYSITHIARLATATGAPDVGLKLLGFADNTFDRLSVPRQPMLLRTYERLVEELRTQMGEAKFTDLYNLGRALSPDKAAEIADSA